MTLEHKNSDAFLCRHVEIGEVSASMFGMCYFAIDYVEVPLPLVHVCYVEFYPHSE